MRKILHLQRICHIFSITQAQSLIIASVDTPRVAIYPLAILKRRKVSKNTQINRDISISRAQYDKKNPVITSNLQDLRENRFY